MKTGDRSRTSIIGGRQIRTDETLSSSRIPRVQRSSDSGFERVQGSGGSNSTFGGLAGRIGQAASQIGFDVMQRYDALTTVGKRVAIGSAVGFVLLLPPGVGQLVHPGVPTGTSPISIMMQEKAEIPTGQRIRQDAAELRNEIPSGTGASRQIALREVIRHYERSLETGRDISSLSSDADRAIAELSDAVAFDARLGYGADWYWFGVPDDHADFHAGRDDAKGIGDHASSVRSALVDVRAEARNEVSNLLVEESPEYAELNTKYRHEVRRLSAATNIRDIANDANDALGTASFAITMRNVTPMTVSRPVYDSEGRQTGTTEDPNPQWYAYNAMAIAAKASAETKIRSLNETMTANRELLAIDADGVDGDLITGWDFFGQPSFLLWSFDSMDVDRAESASAKVRDEMNQMIGDIREVHDPLEREVNDWIDQRWVELGGHGETPAPNGPDQDARLQRQQRLRRREDGGLDWNG